MACVQKIFSVWVVLAIFLSATANAFSFDYKKSFQGPNDSPVASSGSGQVKVRFINTKSGQDVVIGANVGENLLQVADKAGVHVPRSCRSDTCGPALLTCRTLEPLSTRTLRWTTNRWVPDHPRLCLQGGAPGGMGELRGGRRLPQQPAGQGALGRRQSALGELQPHGALQPRLGAELHGGARGVPGLQAEEGARQGRGHAGA
ncbi:unnamed protein product [Heterosigma akashiwo]